MQAEYKGKICDIWQVGRENAQPDWVKQAFQKNVLQWKDDKLQVLMSGLGLADGEPFYGQPYLMADLGDYLDATNHTLVSPKKFDKVYKILDEK